jgi:hypothetical protein
MSIRLTPPSGRSKLKTTRVIGDILERHPGFLPVRDTKK